MIFSDQMISWYNLNKRDLPWRRTKDPYSIWISEIMLQQTGIETVKDYYLRFLEKFPNLYRLAEANLQEVLSVWQGLGYYSRARNLHQTALLIVEHYQGIFPNDYKAILKLPGIGVYTAASICAIAFDQKYAVIDGNVLRVLARYFACAEDIKKPTNRKIYHDLLFPLLPEVNNRDFAQSLMELGALICKPSHPDCHLCPISRHCKAYISQSINQYPVSQVKPSKMIETFSYIVIRYKNYVLLAKRDRKGLLANMWEPLSVLSSSKEDIDKVINTIFPFADTNLEKMTHKKHIFTHRIWELDFYNH